MRILLLGLLATATAATALYSTNSSHHPVVNPIAGMPAASFTTTSPSRMSVAAPHKLECTVTMRYDMREQRSELRILQFVYDDREQTLFYLDDAGRTAKCINSVVGTLEIMGSCGPASVRIDRSTYQLELNTFDYQWNQHLRRHEESWSQGEKGTCSEVNAPQE